jgi:hypothetical protein
MGAALIADAFLARAKRYTAHGICQTAVLLLDLAMILYVMWPSFYSEVVPVMPNHLTDSYYGVSSAHGFLGAAPNCSRCTSRSLPASVAIPSLFSAAG